MPELIKTIALSNPALSLTAYSIFINFWLVVKFIRNIEQGSKLATKERRERDESLIKQFKESKKDLLNVIENNTRALTLINSKLKTEYPTQTPKIKAWRSYN